jgi:maleylpyruvate isomerase
VSRPRGQGEASPLDPDILTAIAGSRDATARLMVSLDKLDDSLAGRPSLLPGWSVGHVVTHLARNADSFVRILEGAAEGREVRQYEGGDVGRNEDIERGSQRSAEEMLDDLRRASARLEAAFMEMPAVVWQRQGLRNNGDPLPCSLVPPSRWREVEVHHVDLGLDYGVSDWPAEFVSLDLPHALDRVPERIEDPLGRAALLAWVYGRAAEPRGIVLRPI